MSYNRREFLGMSCSCLGMLAGLDFAGPAAPQGAQGASMAGWTAQNLQQGFWSADALFLSALKYLKQPEDMVRIATGFGGGILQEDLCGYVTGGVMAIGLFSGAARGNDEEARKRCGGLVKEYMEWRTANFPLHCKDIKKPCDYKMMGEKTSEFLQKMFERQSKKA